MIDKHSDKIYKVYLVFNHTKHDFTIKTRQRKKSITGMKDNCIIVTMYIFNILMIIIDNDVYINV